MMGLTLALCIHALPKNIPYRNTVEKISCRSGIDPRLTEAIIQSESRNKRKTVKKERDGRISYGLMQIEMETARQMGFRGTPRKLMIPWINIFYGVRYLKTQFRNTRFIWDAVSAYNAGRTQWINRKLHYRNTRYVNRVAAHYWKLLGTPHQWDSPEDQRIARMLNSSGGIVFLSYRENLRVYQK